MSPLQRWPLVWAGRALLAIVLLHCAFAAAAFDRLPARLPVHFGADGAPDAYAHPGLGSWFFLVFVSAVAGAIVWIAGIAIFRIPAKWLNIPKKAAFLALPEPERLAVLATVSAFLMLLGATTCAGLFAIQIAQAAIALGALERFPVALPFAVVGATFVVIVAMFVRTSAAVDAAVARRIKEGR